MKQVPTQNTDARATKPVETSQRARLPGNQKLKVLPLFPISDEARVAEAEGSTTDSARATPREAARGLKRERT